MKSSPYARDCAELRETMKPKCPYPITGRNQALRADSCCLCCLGVPVRLSIIHR